MVKTIFIYQNLRELIEPYLSVILPQLMEKFMNKPSEVAGIVIELLMIATQYCVSLVQQLPLIVSHFVKLLKFCGKKHQHCKPCAKKKIGNCVVLFLIVFKESFINYLPMIHREIIHSEEPHELYAKALRNINRYGIEAIHETFTKEETVALKVEPMGPFKEKFHIPKHVKFG